jgi:hypothetical protein
MHTAGRSTRCLPCRAETRDADFACTRWGPQRTACIESAPRVAPLPALWGGRIPHAPTPCLADNAAAPLLSERDPDRDSETERGRHRVLGGVLARKALIPPPDVRELERDVARPVLGEVESSSRVAFLLVRPTFPLPRALVLSHLCRGRGNQSLSQLGLTESGNPHVCFFMRQAKSGLPTNLQIHLEMCGELHNSRRGDAVAVRRASRGS